MKSILQNATPKQLEQAAAENHRQLFCLNAIAEGGEVQSVKGLLWTFGGKEKGSNIVFPALSDDEAGPQLDMMMDWYRQRETKNVGCWSLVPPQTSDLGARLLARGFQPGWEPCWMALDLDRIAVHASPKELSIIPDNNNALEQVSNLPY